MISKSLSTSEKFAGLSASTTGLSEFCQVLYLMMIPHTDDFGRLQGDPFTIKHQCYPASPRSDEEFQEALLALHNAELIIWYQVKGKQFVQITNFEPHQIGLHKRTESKFPNFPGKARKKMEIPSEEKGREEKGTEENLLGAGKAPTPTHDFLGWFIDFYKNNRDGAKYRVTDKHGGIVKSLLKTHSPERLRQLTEVLLGSNDEWIESTDRGIEVLASKINWLEERLCAWERKSDARKVI